ncbi:hypothetical protein JAAARDRAFT_284669 [Jaapia argillacea MUCL 33604]|uniref:Uncharacterized protein n=1 Tax=Jaapia argillacea MUCL 33604 TaxID=933084 RepID=A0A067Q0V8_9AGAM|nr:hypothetical protein JAAARDRAFT_284669 [Jaapia argillacea MUCL 33604]
MLPGQCSRGTIWTKEGESWLGRFSRRDRHGRCCLRSRNHLLITIRLRRRRYRGPPYPLLFVGTVVAANASLRWSSTHLEIHLHYDLTKSHGHRFPCGLVPAPRNRSSRPEMQQTSHIVPFEA